MYETFYQLSTNPFRLTPDANFCFAHASHKQAHAYLEYALELGEGFILVTGRPGTGKTTLIESFVQGVNMNEVTAERIAASNLEATDLLRAVAYAFGIKAEGLDKATLRLRVEQYFIGQQQSGRRVLLFIDEAQSLDHVALEELRMLADLQVRGRPLLQLFLVGQDSLRSLMSAPDMEQFQQRVIGTCFLEPLNLIDTRGYLEYRLRQAHWKGDPEISGAAVVAIYQHSRGVPRHINKTCTRLLLHGVMEGKHKLEEVDVLSIAADLREEQLGPMEYNEVRDPDAVTPMPVPELEDGSVSLDELALRVDPKEAQRLPEPANIATATAIRLATHRVSPPPAAIYAQPITPNWQSHRQVKIPVSGWPDIMVRARPLQQHGLELARNVSGRLHTVRRPRVALGAAIIVTLSLAAMLASSPQNDRSEHSINLVTHVGPIEPLPAQPQATENPGAVQIASESTLPTVVVDSHAIVKDSRVETPDDLRIETLELAALEQPMPVLPAEPDVLQAAPVDVEPVPAPDPREQKISELVSLARQALKEHRLLIPAGNNAYQYFNEVLVLQPGNAVAGDGINEIVQRYTRFATRAFEVMDNDKARLYLRRGLRIRSQDRQLLALQARLDKRMHELETAYKPALVQQVKPPPVEPVVTATPEPKTFLIRLREFFTPSERSVAPE